ncbi:MAG TPA: endonuclease III [Methylomirabilota bacterium]|nr:endonuclease III [Methylomirabilota bacterium]
MARESQPARRERLHRIIQRLQETYPDAHCELKHRNPLELLIATILSAQCSDRQVNRVTESLFRTYRTAADFANATPSALEDAIRSIGLYRNKARNIQACCRSLLERHDGQVPQTLDELVALNGVGRKTANVVLGNAFNISVGVVVDTHVARLSHRLGLTRESSPEKIENDLRKLIPGEHWTMFSHWLIWHGRRRCFARQPDCPHCELLDLCPTGRKSVSDR